VATRVRKRAARSPAIDVRNVRELGDRMLGELGLESTELSVLLTDDAGIHDLNLRHLGNDRPTDVLAFPLDGLDDTARRGERLLGDVVISLETAARQARSRRRELLAEVRFLLAHGLLHLVGYDHATAEQKKEMTAMTRRLVKSALPAPAHPDRHRRQGRNRR
jgi:probable rRNA maturation factor